MIPVSEDWKIKQADRLAPEGYIEIEYWLTDPGVQEEAIASSANQAYFTNIAEITEMTDKKPPLYATAERNVWILDGSMSLIPDSGYGDTGYVSGSIANANTAYGNTPILLLSFDSVHENALPGLSIVWSERYNEYATEFRISAYAGSELLTQKLVTGNTTVESIVEMDIAGYDSIQIEILAWCLPNRRARCSEVRLGLTHRMTKSDLLGFEHSQSVDLLSGTLPKNAVTFRLDNTGGKWNPENPTGIEQYLLERQELTVRYGMDIDGTIEWIKAGTFYMSEWQTPSNGLEATFVARDLFEFMNDVYTGARTGTLYGVALAALQQADLPLDRSGAVRYRVDETLKAYTVDFTTDETEYTIAEVLQLVANAGCCVLYQNRSGVLCMEPLKTVYNGYAVNRHVSYTHPEYVISKELRAVNVNEGCSFIERVKNGVPHPERAQGFRMDVWQKRFAEQGREWEEFSFTAHDLRTTFATMCYDAGVDLHTAKRWMGHSSVETTLSIYTKLSNERRVESTDAMDAYSAALTG